MILGSGLPTFNAAVGTEYVDIEGKKLYRQQGMPNGKAWAFVSDMLVYYPDPNSQPKIAFPNDPTKYLDGDGNFTVPPTGSTSDARQLP